MRIWHLRAGADKIDSRADSAGRAVKIYGQIPSRAIVGSDLEALKTSSIAMAALPFPGVYIRTPKRDFFKLGGA